MKGKKKRNMYSICIERVNFITDVPRETEEEVEFADFDVFNDPKAPYSTFNFTYTHRNFERLSQLMEFNTLLHIEDIKSVSSL